MAPDKAGVDDDRDAYLAVLIAQALDDVTWSQLSVVEALRMCAEFAWEDGYRTGARLRDGSARNRRT